MKTEELIQQAVGGVTRGGELLGAASLIMRRLLLTSAGIFPPNARDLKIKFGNQRPLNVRVVDYAYSPGTGKNFSLLEILEDGADERIPLSFGADVGEGPEIIVPNLDFHAQIPEVTINRGLIRANRPLLDLPAWLFDYKLDTTPDDLLPGTPFLSVEGPHHGIVGILSKKFGTGLESFSLDRHTQPLDAVMPAREILATSHYLQNMLSPSLSKGHEVAETDRPEAPPEGARTDSLRYPVAEFHYLGGDDQNIVPPTAALPDSPPPAGLEFRFRLDEHRTGIPYLGRPLSISQPNINIR